MAVQDYELLLRVRADMIQAINGLDGVRKKLDDVGKEAKDTGDKTGKAVDGMTGKFGGLQKLIAGLAIGAGIKAVFGAVQESENALAQLDARLKSTGGAAGLSREQLIKLSGDMQNLTTYGDEAVLSMESLLLTFTNVRGPVFKDATKTVLDMSVALGQDLKSSATQVGKALNDPILGITALSKVGVNFTDAQKNLIKSLVDTGHTVEAQKIILRELQTEYGGSAEAAANTFGGSLAQLKNAAGDLLEGSGGNLPEVTASVKELTRTLQDPEVKNGFAVMVDGLVSVTTAALNAIGRLGQFGNVVTGLFQSDSEKSLDALYSKRAALQDKIDSFKANPIAGRFGWNKGDIAELTAQLATIDKAIATARDKDFNAHLFDDVEGGVLAKPRKPAGTSSDGVEKKAAESTAKAIAAATALQKQFTDLQGALNPAAAAWNTYNAAVKQANDSADVARQAKGANIASIDAQRNAVIGIAATIRDAALDKLAAADREAWEKLRDSLRTPAEVQIDDALEKIHQLNDLMGKTPVTAEQYAAAIKRIGEGSVIEAPKYQGLDASVGGAMGELSKNFAASSELDKWYAEQQKQNERILTDNDKFRGDDLARQQAYIAAKAETDRQYAERTVSIDRARQQLTLTTASDFFGQLANLQHSSNNKIAKIGKAAAIAQAIINTYQAATAAFSAMASIPVVGPALGAAAAAVAVATGLANVAQIRAQPDSYDAGGYTGPGGRLQVAGLVHRGEGVLNQQEIAALGGPAGFYALRDAIANGYADGGFVGDYYNTSVPSAPLGAGGKNGVAPVNVVIHNNSGAEATTKQSQGSDGSELLEIFINAAAAEARPGGKIARTLDQGFVMRRKGNSYG